MKIIITICVVLLGFFAKAQTAEEKLVQTVKEFHQALVKKNTVSINQQTDKLLTYGHSNGWIENKAALIKNLETGYMMYNSFKEDSVQVGITGNTAHIRFVADIAATLNGKEGLFHLKVMEVWIRKGKRWLLFARQAVK
ncbi:MAG: hypothetical protein RLZZ316_2854 [Bacteroidota bacterium]|jgi:hypothetical protein